MMSHGAEGARPPVSPDRSTGELVRDLTQQVWVLVGDELKLARAEMTRKGKQAGGGTGMHCSPIPIPR